MYAINFVCYVHKGKRLDLIKRRVKYDEKTENEAIDRCFYASSHYVYSLGRFYFHKWC